STPRTATMPRSRYRLSAAGPCTTARYTPPASGWKIWNEIPGESFEGKDEPSTANHNPNTARRKRAAQPCDLGPAQGGKGRGSQSLERSYRLRQTGRLGPGFHFRQGDRGR